MNLRILVAVLALMIIIVYFFRNKDNKLSSLIYLYVATLFSFYPLIFSPIQGYYAMGIFKCRIWAIMTICLALFFVIASMRDIKKSFVKRYFSVVDVAMICFLVAETVSFLIAKDKKLALIGAEGWYTGILFQYGIVFIYFYVSRYLKLDIRLIRIILISAVFVFTIGILHRFLIDPIGIYNSLAENEYIRFLSTIGQATWYSAYLCVVFPMGIHAYLYYDKKILTGAFLFLAAATVVTQNSDSAYGAFFVIMLAYLVIVFGSYDRNKHISRYGEAVVIMSAAIFIIGLLERVFSDHLAELDRLSLEIAQGYIPVIGIVIGFFIMILGKRIGKRINREVILLVIILFAIVMIITGVSFAKKNAGDVYFSLNRNWGNGRGLIWLRTLQMYMELPLINKFIGVGPGEFYDNISNYTDLILANAHNEWLTMLVEAGIIGCLSYISIFIISIIDNIRNGRLISSDDVVVERSFCYVIAVTSLAYIVHGMFNYQQCISTPMMFTLMGMQGFFRQHDNSQEV